MSENTLKFDNIRVNKKEFHKPKQPIDLDLVNVDYLYLTNLSVVMMVLSILLVTKNVKLLNRHVLSYLK